MAYESLYDMQYVTLPASAVRDLSSNLLPTHPLSSSPILTRLCKVFSRGKREARDGGAPLPCLDLNGAYCTAAIR